MKKKRERKKIIRDKKRDKAVDNGMRTHTCTHAHTHKPLILHVKSTSASMFSSDQFCFPHRAHIIIHLYKAFN